MFTISNKSDYGLILLSHLVDKDEYISLKHLVESTNLPPRFIARIAAELVHHNILLSREGKIGGYKLAKSLEKISLYDYLSFFEDDFSVVKCEKDGYVCQFLGICGHNVFFRDIVSTILKKELKQWSLADIISVMKKDKNSKTLKSLELKGSLRQMADSSG